MYKIYISFTERATSQSKKHCIMEYNLRKNLHHELETLHAFRHDYVFLLCFVVNTNYLLFDIRMVITVGDGMFLWIQDLILSKPKLKILPKLA